ncbi:MAG: hypothetical protein AABX07_03275, partial [Nanoarchaeota archaeon]
MASDLNGRQIFLETFVRNLIINAAPEEVKEKIEEKEKVQQTIPIDFEKNIAQYVRENIPSLEKQNTAVKDLQMQQIKQQIIETDALPDIEEGYELREIKFPRSVMTKEIEASDKNEIQIGEITFEKIPFQEKKELMPDRSINKLQTKPSGIQNSSMKQRMQLRRPLVILPRRPMSYQNIPKPTGTPLQKSKFLHP